MQVRAMTDAHRGTHQSDGVLAGHYREGRLFRPPLLAFSATTLASWVRDDLPDLIWPSAVVATAGSRGLGRFTSIQRAFVDRTQSPSSDAAFALDGRCTSIERLEPSRRRDALSILQ